jgi:hypothetical protein
MEATIFTSRMGDLSEYTWDGKCWRWQSPQSFAVQLGLDWDFDVLLHGTPAGPDPTHAGHLQLVAPHYKRVVAEAGEYICGEHRAANWPSGAYGNLTRAVHVLWFKFGVPESERPDEFNVALEMGGDDHGFWQVWFTVDGQAGTWRPCRLEREGW